MAVNFATLSREIGFDAKALEAQRVAQREAAKYVTRVSGETRKALRALIVRGIREQIAPADIARLIRDVVGMDARQIQGAMNYRSELVKRGVPPDRIRVLMGRYVARKIRLRATRIARTEVMNALNTGALNTWGEATKQGVLNRLAKKRVIVTPDDRLCPICRPLAGQVRPLNQPFDYFRGGFPAQRMNPPFHPMCRCTMAVVP